MGKLTISMAKHAKYQWIGFVWEKQHRNSATDISTATISFEPHSVYIYARFAFILSGEFREMRMSTDELMITVLELTQRLVFKYEGSADISIQKLPGNTSRNHQPDWFRGITNQISVVMIKPRNVVGHNFLRNWLHEPWRSMFYKQFCYGRHHCTSW